MKKWWLKLWRRWFSQPDTFQFTDSIDAAREYVLGFVATSLVENANAFLNSLENVASNGLTLPPLRISESEHGTFDCSFRTRDAILGFDIGTKEGGWFLVGRGLDPVHGTMSKMRHPLPIVECGNGIWSLSTILHLFAQFPKPPYDQKVCQLYLETVKEVRF